MRGVRLRKFALLFVGSDKGIYRYDASKNAVYESTGTQVNRQFTATAEAVVGLAVDMVDQKLYAATVNTLYRMNPNGTGLSTIAHGSDFKAITMGRVYGQENDSGLYLLRNDGQQATVYVVALDDLRRGGNVVLKQYHEMDTSLADIAATADGRMMLAQPYIKMMYDISDSRLSYEEWLAAR